jgi:aquaporin rerated protein, other eukaryote
VTLALLLAGAIKPVRAILVFVAQLVGGIAAAAVVDGITPGPLHVSTKLSPEMNLAQGVFLEMFLTTELVLVILMLAVEKHKSTFLAPVGIGGALFVGHIAGVYWTGASLNPARSFGPEVIAGFQSYDWIYWVGPFLGSLLASGFYRLLKFLEYETANPGQDFDDQEAALFKPPVHAVNAADVRRPLVVAPVDTQ